MLVLGDLMLDRYVTGDVNRVSPEGPYLVLRTTTSRTLLGGAGNVANNIAALGSRAILIGGVGDDIVGKDLAACGVTVPAGIDLRCIQIAGRPTTLKTRFMSNGHQLMRVDDEIAAPPTDAESETILATYKAALPEADVVILSDYAKGVLTDTVLPRAIALAREAGKYVVADPKRETFAAYRNANVITPNVLEIRTAVGIHATDDVSAEHAALSALEQSRADAILLTRSEKGLTLVERGRPPLHLPTEARAVSDVSGAGDTLVAVFAVMLARGATLPDAAQVANAAAGLVVAKQGTATVTAPELLAALQRQDLLALDEKVVPAVIAVDIIAGWRRCGVSVGFTNGCFDLIHPGHVRLLNKARARCGRLVVGLNTDSSVKRLKGPARPLQTEMARATVMASIGAVDLVVLFDEDTPLELIRALRPDVLFKGADYRIDQVVGGDEVHDYGGKVSLIGLEQGHSTTGIIERMAVSAG